MFWPVLILVCFRLLFLLHRLLLLTLALILLATLVSHCRFLSKLSYHRVSLLFVAVYYGGPNSYWPELALLSRPCSTNASHTARGYWLGGVIATIPDGRPPLIGPTPILAQFRNCSRERLPIARRLCVAWKQRSDGTRTLPASDRGSLREGGAECGAVSAWK